jgi:hypothetical protein
MFSQSTVEMLRKGPAQIHGMNPYFCCNFGEIPFLVKRVIQVVEEQAKPSGSSRRSVPNDFEVSANEIEQQGFYDERGITIRVSKLSLKSDR